MGNIGNLPGYRLAGLASDLFHKLQKGGISIDELALFIQRKNPFVLERNQHGHVVLTVTGLDLTGAEEVERLKEQKYHIGSMAEACFTITNMDSYDLNHLLIADQTYQIALVSDKEMENDSDRTTAGLLAFGGRFGYLRPQAGIIPRLCERLTDNLLEELGWFYVAALHQPIVDADGNPNVLDLYRNDDGWHVDAFWANSDN